MDLKILQGGQPVTELTVKKGQSYTFNVTNVTNGALAHNLYIGTADKLSTNAVAGLPGIPDFLEGTKTFTYTADQDGPLEFACTVPGHYTFMKGTLKVEP